jgi:hypothetical protein
MWYVNKRTIRYAEDSDMDVYFEFRVSGNRQFSYYNVTGCSAIYETSVVSVFHAANARDGAYEAEFHIIETMIIELSITVVANGRNFTWGGSSYFGLAFEGIISINIDTIPWQPYPTKSPTTTAPTFSPSKTPTNSPTFNPTKMPTTSPTMNPTTSKAPTSSPSNS